MYRKRLLVMLYVVYITCFHIPATEPNRQPKQVGQMGGDNDNSQSDFFGDQLPTGAVIRMGTLRFRGSLANYSAAFSPDGKTIALGGADKLIHFCNAATGEESTRLAGHAKPVAGLAFSPCGRFVVSGSWDQTVRLWEVQTGKELLRFTGHKGRIYTVAYASDGVHVASGGSDGTVRLWDAITGKQLHALDCDNVVYSVAFSPDGKTWWLGVMERFTSGKSRPPRQFAD